MRIIAGIHRGRKIESPEGKRVRPTTDMVRGSIFNMLSNTVDLEGVAVLDVCCGTGAFGLEALSRGAEYAGFIDSHRESLKFAEHNIAQMKETARTSVIAATIEKLPRANREYNIVFVDPPYKSGLIDIAVPSLIKHGWVHKNALLILEMGEEENINCGEYLDIYRERVYSTTKVIFATLKK